MRIIKGNAIGLIIDVQERLYPHIHQNEKLLHNLTILSRGLGVLGVPVLVTEQYVKGLGPTLTEIKEALPSYEPIEKICFSCQDNDDFKQALNQTNKNHVIIAGIETHVCVLQTVLDLIDDCYIPVVVEDCVSSRSENDKIVAIERMRSAGAIITTYESILLELCRVAGNDMFKSISNLIK